MARRDQTMKAIWIFILSVCVCWSSLAGVCSFLTITPRETTPLRLEAELTQVLKLRTWASPSPGNAPQTTHTFAIVLSLDCHQSQPHFQLRPWFYRPWQSCKMLRMKTKVVWILEESTWHLIPRILSRLSPGLSIKSLSRLKERQRGE